MSESRRIVLVMGIVALVSSVGLGMWSGVRIPSGPALGLIGSFLGAAFTPAWISESGSNASLLPFVWEGVVNTVLFAVAGVSIALVIGVVFAVPASSVWHEPGSTWAPIITRAVRSVAAVARSVHELLWALIFLAAIGRSPMAGALAIAIPFGGTLVKVFSDMLNESSTREVDTLIAVGARRSQAIVHGLLPRALPDLSGYAIYRFECGLRSAAILGFLGYPTLGTFIVQSFENLYYREVWTYLYALFVLLAAVEWWAGRMRTAEVRP